MMRFAVSIGGGTNEVLRNNVGERALGLPANRVTTKPAVEGHSSLRPSAG